MEITLEDTLELVHFRHSRMLRDLYVTQLTKLLVESHREHIKRGGPPWQFASIYHHLHSSWSEAKGEVAKLNGGPQWLSNSDEHEQMLDIMLTSSVLRIWGLTKSVYHFHPMVADLILSTPHGGNIPHEALYNLPQWCMYVHIPNGIALIDDIEGMAGKLRGFYAMLDAQPDGYEFREGVVDGKMRKVKHMLHLLFDEIRPAPYEVGGRVSRLSVPLAGTIEDSVSIMAQGTDAPFPEKEALQDLLSRIVGMLLYLSARNREIKGDPRNPDKVIFEKPQTKGRRSLARKQPVTVWEVAWRTGAALEASEAKERQADMPTGASVRPHVRRAHFHHYWCGPGKKRCEVRWIGPVFVNSNMEDDRPVTSHITREGT